MNNLDLMLINSIPRRQPLTSIKSILLKVRSVRYLLLVCLLLTQTALADPLVEPATVSCSTASPLNVGPKNPCDQLNGQLNKAPLAGKYLFSGDFYLSSTDLILPGRGLDFQWTRKYRSRGAQNTSAGNRVDFSYNIYIEQSGADIILHDGNSRTDRFINQGNGTYSAPELSVLGTGFAGGFYTFEFPNRGMWTFYPLNGSPSSGKIQRISDRYNNALTFSYDGLGRLQNIFDTLNRLNTITYNSSGQISSVTDATGRSMQYKYYSGGQSGGSSGDLESVTTPAVLGAPSNTYPSGKTTTYRYTKSFADDALNHDLLSIEDPKKQIYLQNIYAHTISSSDARFTTSSSNINYDRLVKQIIGQNDVIDFFYKALTPSSSNNFAVLKTTINDAVGNVSEHFFDSNNRLVMLREYTGRAANKSTYTNLDALPPFNPPSGKLRPSDPNYFETRFTYNAHAMLTRIDYPNGSSRLNTYEFDLNPLISPRSRGNLREVHLLPGVLGGDQAQISLFNEYDLDAGSYHGTNLIRKAIDGNGNATVYDYDPNGNLQKITYAETATEETFSYNSFGQIVEHVHPDNGNGSLRRDTFSYYLSGQQIGYLQQQTVDSNGVALSTSFQYDTAGNITRRIEPNGNDTLYKVNSLNQVYETSSQQINPGGVRYVDRYYYDANNNLARTEVQNIDEQGNLVNDNPYITIIYEFDLLNMPVRVCQEKGVVNVLQTKLDCAGITPNQMVTEEYSYDGNHNQTLIRSGVATNLQDPFNTVTTLYDERDLVFKIIHAQGSPDQSTTQRDYDGNGNLTRVLEGLESAPRISLNTYDGYNRLLQATDPMGNAKEYHYDAYGNLVSTRIDGNLNGGSSYGRLSEVTYKYDKMNRLTGQTKKFFDTITQNPLQGAQALGSASQSIKYNANSQITSVTNDNGNALTVVYDSANRESKIEDAVGNSNTYSYDANSNLTQISRLERFELSGASQLFVTTYEYDALNRKIKTIDSAGNIFQVGYDSRNNPRISTNAMGKITRNTFDGLNRLTQIVYDMNGNGGTGNEPADIITKQTWDDASRLISQQDDNGNLTSYSYDSLDRMEATQYADGTQDLVLMYDVHDNALLSQDANGSQIDATYDLLNRVTAKTISTGPGVSNATTFEKFKYDGLSRIVRAQDNDSVVERFYDSLSNVTKELLNGKSTLASYDAVGNMYSTTYPGGRIVNFGFSALEQKKTVFDLNGMIASYSYVGPQRVDQRDYRNGTRAKYLYDGVSGVANPPNDFGVKKIISSTHSLISNGSILDTRAYIWDRMDNKTVRADLATSGTMFTHLYSYDSASRMVQSIRLSINPGQTISYTLDGVGNRLAVSGGTLPGTYSMSTLNPEPADAKVNQYTTTPFDARSYSKSGNLNSTTYSSGGRTFIYDYRDQLVEVLAVGDSLPIAKYSYDAFGRRIAKLIKIEIPSSLNSSGASIAVANREPQVSATAQFGKSGTGGGGGGGGYLPRSGASYTYVLIKYFYNGWQIVEEQDSASTTLATYVYGNYIDEVLSMRRGANDYYYHTDDNFNVMAVSNASGAVVERYEYGDFGEPIIFNANYMLQSKSNIENPYLFMGRQYDPETGFYYFRTRYLDPLAGRFISRDGLGMWGDPMNLGNGSAFAGNTPWSELDPFGLAAGDGIGGVDVGLKKKPPSGSELTGVVFNVAGDGIGGVDVGLKKKPGGEVSLSASDKVPNVCCNSINFTCCTMDGYPPRDNGKLATASNGSTNGASKPVLGGAGYIAAPGDGIGGVDVGLKKKPGGELSMARDGVGNVDLGLTTKPGGFLTVAAAGDGIGGVDVGLKKKPGGELSIPAAGDGIGGVDVGLKKKPGGSMSIAAPGDGIGGVDVCLKKRPGGEIGLMAAPGDGIGGVDVGLKKKSGGQMGLAAAGDGIGGVDVGLKKKTGES